MKITNKAYEYSDYINESGESIEFDSYLIPAECFGKTWTGKKLSNSGDSLKHIVPNFSRKAISGWTNYSCMVTSYMMNVNEMGYRGSKSDFLKSVKEQRVDGSWFLTK